MDWIVFITALLLSVFAYFIGLTRGTKETELEHAHDYDQGYIDGFRDAKEDPHKAEKIKVLVDVLDDMFKDDEDEIIDGGEY